ncbi:MAG: hypothetical protein FWH49_08910, partial [Clostridiales bacterium]|nr:hypothetical protein [Clostridiales bacterium]
MKEDQENDNSAAEQATEQTVEQKSKPKGNWIVNQFKAHTIRSVTVTVPVAAALVVGILWFFGAFIPKEHWDYLPNRAYIEAPARSRSLWRRPLSSG